VINSTVATAKQETVERTLVDTETGELFTVVYEDIERAMVKSRSISTTRLVVELTGVSSLPNRSDDRIQKIPKFILSYKSVWGYFGDIKVSQYEKAVFRILIENMGYQNKVQVRSSVIADMLGIKRPDVSKAMKSLKDKGMVVECKPNKLIPDVPVYRIDPRIVFAGQDSQQKRAVAVFSAAWERAQRDETVRLVRVK
jgi:hypothetical protein